VDCQYLLRPRSLLLFLFFHPSTQWMAAMCVEMAAMNVGMAAMCAMHSYDDL
jgi:hypothetical protein